MSTEELAKRLQEQIEKNVPEAEELHSDVRFRLVVLEEGFALLLKEAAKSMHAVRMEAEMRAEKPDGPNGDGWQFSFHRLVGEEAGIIHQQAKGLLKLGKNDEIWEAMGTAHKKLVDAWAPALPIMSDMYESRMNEDPSEDVALDYIEEILRVLKISHNLFQGIANGRVKRLGPKRAALAKFNAESLRIRVKKRQQKMLEAAVSGEVDAKEEDASEEIH